MTYVWMMKYRKETEVYNGLTEKQWFGAAFEGRHPWHCRSYEERIARQARFEEKSRLREAKKDAKVQAEELRLAQIRRQQKNPDHIRSRLRPARGSGAAFAGQSRWEAAHRGGNLSSWPREGAVPWPLRVALEVGHQGQDEAEAAVQVQAPAQEAPEGARRARQGEARATGGVQRDL